MNPDQIATKSDVLSVFDRLDRRLSRLQAMIEGATITPAPEWLTVTEAARVTGRSRQNIYDKIKAGELKTKCPAGGARLVMVPPELRR